ncbi:MAG: trypsin-like peptidase domain-containing protein [bacterium]|nr:trypsin-like peptidase domain-containing protein [bacterium]MCY3632177.1 trypsin-like peptidase domain-containing protein [bacterium]
MNNEPEDPRSEWDPLGWELEGPTEQSRNLPTPRAVEVVSWVPTGSPPNQPRNPAVIMLVTSVVLAVFGLVGIGIGVGSVFFNRDAPTPEVIVVSGPQVVSASPQASPSLQTPLVVAPSDSSPSEESSDSNQLAAPLALGDPVVAVARAVIPSVVLIEVDVDQLEDLEFPELPPEDWEPGDELPEDFRPPDQEPRYGQGSGIIYDASGLILTNAHVLDDAETVRVQFADGTRAEGVVIGTAPAIDVGLVRVDTDMTLTPAVFADRSTVEVGQLAVAVGSPFGLQQSVTSGIVSAVGRAVREGSGGSAFVEMIQTDAPINPGNSGGALANSNGQVIGMNTLIQTDGSFGNIGLGFAIPSDIALNIAQRILNGESTELGYLGVYGTDPEIGHPGALVVEVTPDTPAERAGLMAGDLIVLIDDEVVSTFTELAAKVQFRVPGTEVELEVVRDDEHITLTVVIGSRPSFEEPDEEE